MWALPCYSVSYVLASQQIRENKITNIHQNRHSWNTNPMNKRAITVLCYIRLIFSNRAFRIDTLYYKNIQNQCSLTEHSVYADLIVL